MTTPVDLGEQFIQDRPGVYARLLAEGPPVRRVTQPDGLRVWIVTGHAEARRVLTDPALSKDSRRAAPLHERQQEQGVPRTMLAKALESHMLNLDPPDHTRLRRLIGREFTPRRVAALRPWVTRVADDLIAAMAGRERVDVLDAFAFPLTVTVIGELFGVPVAERDGFRALSDGIAFGADPAAIGRASEEMADYLDGLVRRRRDSPGDDLLSALVRAGDEEDRLSEVELVSMAFLMLTAGFETTAALIGNGVVTLLTRPDQLALVRADPALLDATVEELLRHTGSVAMTTLYFTTAPIVVGGVEIPEGEFVEVLLGGANRDPAVFADPDRFDVHRPTTGHVAFGHGAHYCLGAPLARMEARVGFARLFDAFPGMALAEPVESLRRRNSLLFNGYERVPVLPAGAR